DAYDAYVALGCANYIIGSLPGSARFMLWFGGIHGDKQLGMQQVQKTVDGGRYLKPFAQILLALSARREKQDALAQKLLKDLTEEFPGNSVYIAEYEKALARPNRITRGRTSRVAAALDSLMSAPASHCRWPAFWSPPLQFASRRPSNKTGPQLHLPSATPVLASKLSDFQPPPWVFAFFHPRVRLFSP